MSTMTPQALTADSQATFALYAEDAGNWDGCPWVSIGNIDCTKAMRGNLSDLVQKGLINIHEDDGDKYVAFTPAGVEYAATIGIDLSWTL